MHTWGAIVQKTALFSCILYAYYANYNEKLRFLLQMWKTFCSFAEKNKNNRKKHVIYRTSKQHFQSGHQ